MWAASQQERQSVPYSSGPTSGSMPGSAKWSRKMNILEHEEMLIYHI